MGDSLLVSLVVGALQGLLEWVPLSSEGSVTVALEALGHATDAAVGLALVLHLGTMVAATAYLRRDVAALAGVAGTDRESVAEPSRGTQNAPRDPRADRRFLLLATLASGVSGLLAYVVLDEVVTAVSGGAVIALVGLALVVTGLVQRSGERTIATGRRTPTGVDAVLTGLAQGVAVLPGISRSGTTVSVLLLRGYDGDAAFRLSFLLSIPAALGASGLVYLDHGGVPAVEPAAAGVALASAAVVGYASMGALLAVARRTSFWAICVGLGGVATIGGAAVALA